MSEKITESKLNQQQQIFVVQALACFERPSDVQAQLKENFGVEISLPAISYYQPANRELPAKLKTLFNSTRKKFLADASRIPIANKSYRLQKLQKMFEAEEKNDGRLQNKKAMREILEQAAKESGDAFTNKQKVEVSDPKGEPLKITVEVVESASRALLPDSSDEPQS